MQSSTSSNNRDKIVYFGVININENGRNIGAVDIWRSLITKIIFCEEKRLGILDITDKIGMPQINDNQVWAVAVNRYRKGKDKWRLISIIKDGENQFVDTDEETRITVQSVDFKIIDKEWWSFLVAENVNKSIEITNEMK
ncbi:MAG: hypothetical protein AB7V56_05495 [Candidatus Nitrosocosmicus sp.]|jgi:hypothetical protein|nr:hypothetical protein [Candidatus Nitrosocosmicus sp. SS]KAA2280838.1 hypothetical protein F1Z66_09915 [Candidatus Nitrosocosmicus sp. SS]KAF0869018.1 hypothetical protein E5N71_07720 [Candidatus Nitrosocosmicus sp. SS]MDR4492152.1 hypothetical protein [Candidatus Nitrosocosmicus sp.]